MFKESLRIALGAIWVNKMRSLLTTLGIIIGVSSVIAVVALGDGLKTSLSQEFESFGVKRIIVYINRQEEVSERDNLNHGDFEAISRAFEKDIKALTVNFQTSGKVVDERKGKKEINIQLAGVNEQYPDIESIDMKEGRFLLEGDVAAERAVGVIDQDFAEQLFGRSNVVGERVNVNLGEQTVSFVIVGVYEASKSGLAAAFGVTPTPIVYIPISKLESLLGVGDMVYQIDINLNDGAEPEQVIERMKPFLERRHNALGKNYYNIDSAEKGLEAVNNFTGILTMAVGAIAAISLVVGGIGVMNIMLVSVTERTREIGIRKSLGARRQDILMQFLVEAVIISFLGGIIGTLMGAGLAYGISALIKIPPHVGAGTVMVAWLFSAGVGIFFGIYPANKASRLDPIDALRYE